MATGRLISEIKHIEVIKHDVETLSALKKQKKCVFSAHEHRWDHTLYVAILEIAKSNQKLYLSYKWPAFYKKLVDQGKADDLILINDDEKLLEKLLKLKSGSHDTQVLISGESAVDKSKRPSEVLRGILDDHCKNVLTQNSFTDPFSSGTVIAAISSVPVPSSISGQHLISKIKKVEIIEYDAKKLSDVPSSIIIEDNKRKENTLYVLKLKGARENCRLYLFYKWPESYKKLVDNKKADDLVGIDDDNDLLWCTAGHHDGKKEDEKYRKILEKHCNEAIKKSHEEKSHEEKSPSSRLKNIGEHNLDYLLSSGAFEDTRIFSEEEERKIRNFFGSDLVDSVIELKKIFNQEHLKTSNSSQLPGEAELGRLINELRNKTPSHTMSKEQASNNAGVIAIANAATALKNAIPLLTKWQKAGRLIAKIVDAIALAAPGVYLGAVYGASVGAGMGGGVFSIPAATVGGIVGGLIGGGFGFFLNYNILKPAQRFSRSRCGSNALAKIHHVDTIVKVAEKMTPQQKQS